MERELALEQWEAAVAEVIKPGMLPEEIALVACQVTVELMQGRVYFGRVHKALFRDRAIAQLARTGNSEQLADQFNLSSRHVRRIIREKRAMGGR